MSRRQKMKKNLKMYSQTLYEVERVVQVRWKQHRQEFLIKWKGYDDCYNTWEPKEHITFYYKQAPQEEKDDDPQYVENIPLPPSTPHKYETRAKKDKTRELAPTSALSREELSHQQEDYLTPDHSFNPLSLKKPPNDSSCDELQIRKKGEEGEWFCEPKESLVKRIVSLGWDQKKSKRVGLVETTGHEQKFITLQQDILKSRYPNKIIEYYEQQMRQRSGRYY